MQFVKGNSNVITLVNDTILNEYLSLASPCVLLPTIDGMARIELRVYPEHWFLPDGLTPLVKRKRTPLVIILQFGARFAISTATKTRSPTMKRNVFSTNNFYRFLKLKRFAIFCLPTNRNVLMPPFSSFCAHFMLRIFLRSQLKSFYVYLFSNPYFPDHIRRQECKLLRPCRNHRSGKANLPAEWNHCSALNIYRSHRTHLQSSSVKMYFLKHP